MVTFVTHVGMSHSGVLKHRLSIVSVALLLILFLYCRVAVGEIRVTDDAGRHIVLNAPAERIVSLAPYITELLFAAGAGKSVVGVSAFSDFPPPARAIARIGAGTGIDQEQILALRPDLVIAWKSGNPAMQVKQLERLGLTVFLSEPRKLEDIAFSLSKFGVLAGTQPQAESARQAFARRLSGLRQRHAGKPQLSVFYQVWDQPLMTISDDHVISDVIRLCGGRNVFSGLTGSAPQIVLEAVLERDPQVIIAATDAEEELTLQQWRRWPAMQAVKHGQLYTIPGDLLVRHTPRILDGTERLCAVLDQARVYR